MTQPTDERLLAFLEGELTGDEAAAMVRQIESDPALAERVKHAAAGLAAMRALSEEKVTDGASPAPGTKESPIRVERPGQRLSRRPSPWWMVAASAASIAAAVPITWAVASSSGPSTPTGGAVVQPVSLQAEGRPVEPEPSFVLVLHGLWPDAATIGPARTRERASEYWAWVDELADRDLLIAAGDLRWEPGQRLGPGGSVVTVDQTEVEQPQFVVGMFALRVSSYEEARALAAECPHLRYGGQVSVRRVAAGFVTTDASDWGQ